MEAFLPVFKYWPGKSSKMTHFVDCIPYWQITFLVMVWEDVGGFFFPHIFLEEALCVLFVLAAHPSFVNRNLLIQL